MKIEIWSDVMCPFCYIGKRKFEKALAQFKNKEGISIEWKSFLLAPELKTDPTKNTHEFLAAHKNIALEEAKSMNDYVAGIAAQQGLQFHFDHAVPANSFNAHRLLHFAKQQGKQHEAEEKLFSAYFTEGRNIDDAETLVAIAAELGLDTSALATAMGSGSYTDAVLADVTEAQQLGVRGVPFFVFNRKYAISGAQEPEVFLQTLDKAFTEWQKESGAGLEIIDGESCAPGEECG